MSAQCAVKIRPGGQHRLLKNDMPRGNIAAVGQTCSKATLAAVGQTRLGTGQIGEKSFEKRYKKKVVTGHISTAPIYSSIIYYLYQ